MRLRHLVAEAVTVTPVPFSSLISFRHRVVSVMPRRLSRKRTFYREDRPQAEVLRLAEYRLTPELGGAPELRPLETLCRLSQLILPVGVLPLALRSSEGLAGGRTEQRPEYCRAGGYR